jgi:microcystin-dependent protein
MPPMLGQIELFPYDFAPAGWMFCDGSLLSIAENEALFQLLGTTFGGDGESTFGLPDLRAAARTNCNYCISTFGPPTQNSYEVLSGKPSHYLQPPLAPQIL